MKTAHLNSRLLDGAVFALLLLLAILQGYVFCCGDMDTYLPFILHEHDPSLFRSDLLLGTLASHPVYIWKFMALFLAWIGPESLIRIAFLFQTLVIAVGALLFYKRFFGPGRGWMLFLLLLVVPVSTAAYGRFGLNPYGYFHAGALGFGVALVAIVLIDKGSWLLAGALCGGLFLAHPITAVYTAGFFFVSALFECVRAKRVPLKLVAGAAVLLVTAAPSFIGAFHSLAAPAAAPSLDPALWRKLAEGRMAHGYFMSLWVPDRFVQIALCIAALFLLYRKHPAFRRLLPILIVVGIGLTAAAAGDLFSIRFFLRLQLGRCSYFLFFLLVAFAAHTLITIGRQKAALDRSSKIRWGFSALIVLLVLGDAALHGQPLWSKTALIIFLCLAAMAALIGALRQQRPVLLFSAIAFVVTIATLARAPGAVVWTHAQVERDPWIATALWCRNAVPQNEVVMTPLTYENFRPYALRATYCSWKDGAPHCFVDSTLAIWWQRMQKFGVSLPLNREALPALYHAHALEVARAEHIRYVVFDKWYARATGPVAYENDAFGVIDLDGWDGYGLEKVR
jgi:hypothetical protein